MTLCAMHFLEGFYWWFGSVLLNQMSLSLSFSQFCLPYLSLHRHIICSLRIPEICFGNSKGEPYLKQKSWLLEKEEYICYFPNIMDIIYFNLQSSFRLYTSDNKQWNSNIVEKGKPDPEANWSK